MVLGRRRRGNAFGRHLHLLDAIVAAEGFLLDRPGSVPSNHWPVRSLADTKDAGGEALTTSPPDPTGGRDGPT